MMMSLPTGLRHSAGPALLAIISILLFFFEPVSGQLFAYDRYAIQGFETWRLISGNLVHTNGYHVLLNLGGLVMLWALHGEHYLPVRFLKVMLWCCIFTSAGLYLFSPALIWYAGLSGALHGLFTWGACMDIRMGLRSGYLLLAGLAVKVGWEQIYGSSDSVAALINANVAVDAHLYGALGGIVVFALMLLFARRK